MLRRRGSPAGCGNEGVGHHADRRRRKDRGPRRPSDARRGITVRRAGKTMSKVVALVLAVGLVPTALAPAGHPPHPSGRGSTSTPPTCGSSSSRSRSPSGTPSTRHCGQPVRDAASGPSPDQIPVDDVGDTLPWGLRTRRRHLQQPRRRPRRVGTADQKFPRLVPKVARAGRGRRPGRRRTDPADREQQLHPDLGQRPGQPAAHHQQPRRRPDDRQPGRRGRGRRSATTSPGVTPSGDVLHPERRTGRRPVGAVQLVVHALRPVLRPRPGPGDQGRRTARCSCPSRRTTR